MTDHQHAVSIYEAARGKRREAASLAVGSIAAAAAEAEADRLQREGTAFWMRSLGRIPAVQS